MEEKLKFHHQIVTEGSNIILYLYIPIQNLYEFERLRALLYCWTFFKLLSSINNTIVSYRLLEAL